MQINASDYYQSRAPLTPAKCCSGRVSRQQIAASTTMATDNTEHSMRISTTIRGAELLCCCCSCSTATSAKSPGLIASLGVCLLIFGYTLLGAFAFMALEGGFKTTSPLHQEYEQNEYVSGVVPSAAAAAAAAAKDDIFTKGVATNANTKNGKNQVSSASAAGGVSLIVDGDVLSENSNNNDNINNDSPPVIWSSPGETISPAVAATLSPLPNVLHRDILVEDSSTRQLRAYTVERLWSITEDLNVLYKENWTRLAEQEVLDFQEKMAQHSLNRARTAGSSMYGTTSGAVQRTFASGTGSSSITRRNDEKRFSSVSGSHRRRWTFGTSFLYSLTLITTIGYGSTSPRTVWGRLITIVYALAGIPLMLVYLSTIGDVLARNFRKLYGRFCGRVECSKIRDRNGAAGVIRDGQSSSSSPPPPPPPPPLPLPGSRIIGKTSYHRYDNHIENKLAAGHHFYSSKSSSSDNLGLCSTGSAVLLDCSGETVLDTVPSGASCNFQDANASKHHRHLYSCSGQQTSARGGISGDPGASCHLVRIPITLCLVIILLYICCGAVMFNQLEGWSLLEGSYFCFTSLGTIGFGDLVPSGGNVSNHVLEELCLCACSLYILAGMGLIAMCFNLMQEEVVRVVRVFGRTCGNDGTSSSIGNSRSVPLVHASQPAPPSFGYSHTSRAATNAGIKSDLSIDAYDRHNERDNDNEAIAMSLVSTTS